MKRRVLDWGERRPESGLELGGKAGKMTLSLEKKKGGRLSPPLKKVVRNSAKIGEMQKG